MKKVMLFFLIISCNSVHAIPQYLPQAEVVAGAHGKIYGGQNGSLWKEISDHRAAWKKNSSATWKNNIGLFVLHLKSRIGLYQQQKLNMVLELVSDRYKQYTPAQLRDLLVGIYGQNNINAMLDLINQLGYSNIYDYIK